MKALIIILIGLFAVACEKDTTDEVLPVIEETINETGENNE